MARQTPRTRAKSGGQAIPQACPKCHREHWIPLDKMHLQMICKQCKAQFYVDATGGCRLGKRPANLDDSLASGSHLHVATGRRKDILDPFAWFERLPAVVKLVLLGAVLAAAGLTFRAWVEGHGMKPPGGLPARARAVAEAFALGDRGKIRGLSTDGSDLAIESWLKEKRPSTWRTQPGQPTRVDIRVEKQNAKSKMAIVRLTVEAPQLTLARSASGSNDANPEPPSPAAPAPTDPDGEEPPPFPGLPLLTIWTQDDRGEWVLDAGKTAKAN